MVGFKPALAHCLPQNINLAYMSQSKLNLRKQNCWNISLLIPLRLQLSGALSRLLVKNVMMDLY